jgi:hypothetical protein
MSPMKGHESVISVTFNVTGLILRCHVITILRSDTKTNKLDVKAFITCPYLRPVEEVDFYIEAQEIYFFQELYIHLQQKLIYDFLNGSETSYIIL